MAEGRARVTIITVSYNSANTIAKTLRSVLAQKYRPLEYVLVDGGSSDGTVEIISREMELFKSAGIEVNFKSEPDCGISDAFNKGIERAHGDIIGILNSDDELMDGTIEYVAENFPDGVDVYYGDCLWEDAEKGVSYVRKSGSDLRDLKLKLRILHPSSYVRRSAYLKYGAYDLSYKFCMDKELFARMQRKGGSFLYAGVVMAKVSSGGASDRNLREVFDEGRRIAVSNGVPPALARVIFCQRYLVALSKSILKRVPLVARAVAKVKNSSAQGDVSGEMFRKKPYLYDLYRWTGKIDRASLFKWLMVSKYRIVYLKRKCELNRTHIFRFVFYRMLYGHYMTKYGVDIGAGTQIGAGFVIRHIGGIAVNADSRIGKDVELMQGVTIGCERRGSRAGCPTVGDRVWIGANAAIVGNVKIGDNVLIAAGAFVNFDVPDNSIVVGNPARIIPRENAVERYIENTLEF